MNNNDIVIVGSGCSILGSGLGAEIDSLEYVVRFGGSEVHLEDNREDTGVKTTRLFHNCNTEALDRLLFRLNSNIEFYKDIHIVFTFIDTIYKGYKITLPNIIKLLELKGISYNVKRIPRRLKLNRLILKPTSGLFCILSCLNNYDNIYLCGFDALCTGAGAGVDLKNISHFYKGECKLGRDHDILKEANIIRHLMGIRGNIHIL